MYSLVQIKSELMRLNGQHGHDHQPYNQDPQFRDIGILGNSFRFALNLISPLRKQQK